MEETKTNTKEVEKLFAVGAHLGHKKNRLHPKAKKYVYSMVNGVAVIDLTKTAAQLNAVKKFLTASRKEGKVLLAVGTKRVASQYMQELCKENKIPHITTKWMPGLLTNFETLSKNIKKMNELDAQKENGTWDQFVKHERTKLSKELGKLKRLYSGITDLKKKPDILFIVDIKREKNSLKEAQQYNIPVVAITDTNTNPDTVTYPVVANDDSPSSAQYVIKEILSSYCAEKTVSPKAEEVHKEVVDKKKEIKTEEKQKTPKKTVKKEKKA